MISLYNILINEASTPVETAILNAIKNKQQVALYYMGDKEEGPGWRKGVYPLLLATYKGKKYVRAWQESGKTLSQVPEWKLFRLDRIRNWNLMSTKRLTAPPDSRWNPNGDNWKAFGKRGFDSIIAQAKF